MVKKNAYSLLCIPCHRFACGRSRYLASKSFFSRWSYSRYPGFRHGESSRKGPDGQLERWLRLSGKPQKIQRRYVQVKLLKKGEFRKRYLMNMILKEVSHFASRDFQTKRINLLLKMQWKVGFVSAVSCIILNKSKLIRLRPEWNILMRWLRWLIALVVSDFLRLDFPIHWCGH